MRVNNNSDIPAAKIMLLDANNPWEVEQMIYNLELTLEEMQRQALLKGEQRGEQKGERKGKQEVARNMLLLNVDVETIVKYTGLSLEEINALKKQVEH